MKEIIIGLVSGIVSGTGMGGGTILIFLLTYISGLEQHIAQATNLIYVNKNINIVRSEEHTSELQSQ